MATTKIWPVRDNLRQVIDYAKNPAKSENPEYVDKNMQGFFDVMSYATNGEKTEKRFFVSGVNCIPSAAQEQMLMTKQRYGKMGGVVAFHAYQSFRYDEASPETAHEIGVKTAEKLWGDRFEVVVSTHLNTDCAHNHFVINSVSFTDGKRLNDNLKSHHEFRDVSDCFCREYNLSVIENPSPTHTPRNIYMAEKRGKATRYNIMRSDIDEAIKQSLTTRNFISAMERMGYEVKFTGKYWTIKAHGQPHATRLKTLGEDYTEDAIKDRIMSRISIELSPPKPRLIIKSYKFKGNLKTTKKIGGLRGLYLHYCYLLGILPKNSPHKPTHPLLKADLIRMDEYIAQTKLLVSHKIETQEQLLSFIYGTKQKVQSFTTERATIYNHLRRCKDETKTAAYIAQRDAISKQLSSFYKELKSANGILERSNTVKYNIHQVKMVEAKEREEKDKYQVRALKVIAWGSRGRKFNSCHSDQEYRLTSGLDKPFVSLLL